MQRKYKGGKYSFSTNVFKTSTQPYARTKAKNKINLGTDLTYLTNRPKWIIEINVKCKAKKNS